MKLSLLEKLDVRKVILYVLITLFAYSISGAVFKIMAERTLGSIFRHLMFTTPYLFLIILVSLYDTRRFSFSSFVPTLPLKLNMNLILKRYSWIILLAILIGIISSFKLFHLGLLYGLVIIFVIGSLIISCFCMASGKGMFGIVMFLIAIPFLYFIQREHGSLGFELYKMKDLFIPLDSIYLLILFIFFTLTINIRTDEFIPNKETRFFWLCAFFLVTPVISIIFSKDFYQSSIYYLLTLVIPFMYFFILLKSINRVKDIKILTSSLVLCIFVYLFFSLYYRLQMGGIVSVTTQVVGYEELKNVYTGFRSSLIPLIIPFTIVWYYYSNKIWKKSIITLIVIFFISYLILSNKRVVILGAFAGLAVLFYYSRISTLKKIFIIITVLLLFFVTLIYFPNILEPLEFHRAVYTFQQFFSGESLNIISSDRISIWQSSLAMIRDFPLFGIGPGMWNEHIAHYDFKPYIFRDIYGKIVRSYAIDPHNLYILMWLDYGILVLVLYIILLYSVFKKSIKVLKTSSSRLLRNLSLAAVISLTVWISMSFFTMRFIGDTILVPIVFWSIIAIIVRLNSFNSNNQLG